MVIRMPVTHGQVDCTTIDTLEQCETGYYCDGNYRCIKCAQCENFETVNKTSTCPKTLDDCGECKNGYEFHSPGKCVEQYTLRIFFFLVGAASSTAILILIVVCAAFYCIRKKKKRSKTRYCPEADSVINSTAVLLSAQHPTAPPPPYTGRQPPYNPQFNDNEPSKPLIPSNSSPCVQEMEMDGQQMANPYSNCVNLPHDINSYNFEESTEESNENLFENEEMEENVNDPADVLNNNNLPAADPEAESLLYASLLSDITRVQDSNTNVGIADRDHGSDSDTPRSGTPAADACGSQHLIVQFINNISPVLNLQGNNTKTYNPGDNDKTYLPRK
ncbi:uncharacterized protein LOC128669417 isoform X2 [Plodia interpunctella]|nr:uncharacterized protein LOC128669417 isoform X2 [Plodia interpunctella]